MKITIIKIITRFAVSIPLAALIVSCGNHDTAILKIEIVHTFDQAPPWFRSPEGIAMDRDGNIFVSVRTLDGPAITKNEIARIGPSRRLSTLSRNR
jgi:hypothetical protein